MTLDHDFLALRAGDVAVPLSRLEFIVINRLLKAAGGVVLWDDILFAAYQGDEPDGDPTDTVRVTIRNLKAKLARNGLPMPVSNVPGKGFKVEGLT